LRPTTFKQLTSDTIAVSWDDGHESTLSLRTLRDHCPCAGCKGETVLLRTYTPPEADKSVPGRYDLKAVEPVGNYALKLTWGDGHAMGMYTWEQLRSLCECEACTNLKQVTERT
jgi:DUF971 family protein